MTLIPSAVLVRVFPGSSGFRGSAELPEPIVTSPALPVPMAGGVVGNVGPVCAMTLELAANAIPAAKPRNLIARIWLSPDCRSIERRFRRDVQRFFVSLFVKRWPFALFRHNPR